MPSLDSWNPLCWPLTSGLKAWSAEQAGLSVQFSSVTQSCPVLCDPVNRSTPGLPVQTLNQTFTQAQNPQLLNQSSFSSISGCTGRLHYFAPKSLLISFWSCTTEETNETPPVSRKMLKTLDCHLWAVTWFLPLLPSLCCSLKFPSPVVYHILLPIRFANLFPFLEYKALWR